MVLRVSKVVLSLSKEVLRVSKVVLRVCKFAFLGKFLPIKRIVHLLLHLIICQLVRYLL